MDHNNLNAKDIKIKSTKLYVWKPTKDITTYELALCMPVLINFIAYGIQWQVSYLPYNVKRHFKEVT